MKLVIVHYHLRPGGIRRIIELATPHLVSRLNGQIRSVVIATGEAGDPKWTRQFQQLLRGTPVEFFLEPSFNYLSEQRRATHAITRRLRKAMDRLLGGHPGEPVLVWAHNLGIARNLLLTRELVRACSRIKAPLMAHHHDWWFDNRWLRWPEMRRHGFRRLSDVARTVFPALRNVHHLSINHSEAAVLRRHFPKRAGWLPNLSEHNDRPTASRVRAAHTWLRSKIGDHDSPVWLLPCRLLRRKNVAEALLLTHWLRPGAWLVTTGGVSSADEKHYADKLGAAARRHHWRLRMGVLQGDEAGKPEIPELLAASEAVLLTSIQEGFGLPYLEAAAARRPLIARSLPNIAPDLDQFGFAFPQYYEEIRVAPRLFDWKAERKRQQRMFSAWRRHLPRTCHKSVGKPALLAAGSQPQPVPFSRLTLTAQIEILCQPSRQSWDWCLPLNPFLARWKTLAGQSRLKITPWPAQADDWLSGPAYADRFAKFLATQPSGKPAAGSSTAAQRDFIRDKLGAVHLFPLLWSRLS